MKVSDEVHQKIQENFMAYSVDDQKTKQAIKKFYEQTGEVLDPHTAIGAIASEEFIASKDYQGEIVITLATAHSAKFPDAVISSQVSEPKLPNFLSDLHSKKEKFDVIKNHLETIKNYISIRV